MLPHKAITSVVSSAPFVFFLKREDVLVDGVSFKYPVLVGLDIIRVSNDVTRVFFVIEKEGMVEGRILLDLEDSLEEVVALVEVVVSGGDLKNVDVVSVEVGLDMVTDVEAVDFVVVIEVVGFLVVL